jgi:hypothetical protein
MAPDPDTTSWNHRTMRRWFTKAFGIGPTPALIGVVAAWLVSLLVAPSAVLFAVAWPHSWWMPLAITTTTSLIATSGIIGWAVGDHQVWRRIGQTALLGTGALAIEYALVTLALTSPTDTSADNMAGAGAAVLAGPEFVALASMLAVGAGLRFAFTRIRYRRARAGVGRAHRPSYRRRDGR